MLRRQALLCTIASVPSLAACNPGTSGPPPGIISQVSPPEAGVGENSESLPASSIDEEFLLLPLVPSADPDPDRDGDGCPDRLDELYPECTGADVLNAGGGACGEMRYSLSVPREVFERHPQAQLEYDLDRSSLGLGGMNASSPDFFSLGTSPWVLDVEGILQSTNAALTLSSGIRLHYSGDSGRVGAFEVRLVDSLTDDVLLIWQVYFTGEFVHCR